MPVLVEKMNILIVIIQHVLKNVAVNKNSKMLLHKTRNVSNIVVQNKLLIRHLNHAYKVQKVVVSLFLVLLHNNVLPNVIQISINLQVVKVNA